MDGILYLVVVVVVVVPFLPIQMIDDFEMQLNHIDKSSLKCFS